MNQVVENLKIENLIYEINGIQVILDSDLAKLYQCKNGTKEINQAVNRNIEKFPTRFSWILSDKESEIFLVTNCDQKMELRGGRFKNPRVFTEQGGAMLATILKSKVAVNVSIGIMDAFVAMRRYLAITSYSQRLNNVETKIIEHDSKFDEVFSKLEKEKNNHIFFEGQIYDAYSLLIDILKEAKKSIIIIDNYIDKKLLDILSKVDKKVTIVTNHINKMDLEKYNEQYHSIHISINTSFHDRFIILDKITLYHCGASFKDLGKKCFAISKLLDNQYLKDILQHIM